MIKTLRKIFDSVPAKDIYNFLQVIEDDYTVDDDFFDIMCSIYKKKSASNKVTLYLANGRKIKIAPIEQTRTFAASNSPYHQMVQGILFYRLVQKFGIERVITETSTKYFDFPDGKNPDIIILDGCKIKCVVEVEIAKSISGNTNTKARVYKALRSDIPFCVVHVRDVKNVKSNKMETVCNVVWRSSREDIEVENCIYECEDLIKSIDKSIFKRNRL